MGDEARSITTTRSSLNDTTTVPMSGRSVSFKDPIVHEIYETPSSKSQQSTVISTGRHDSVLDRLGIFILFNF